MSEKMCHSNLDVKMLTSFSKEQRRRGKDTTTNSIIILLTVNIV